MSTELTIRTWPANPIAEAGLRWPREWSPDELEAYQIGTEDERRRYRKAKLYPRLCEGMRGDAASVSAGSTYRHSQFLKDLRTVVALAGIGVEPEDRPFLECVLAAVEQSGSSDQDIREAARELQALISRE